MCLGVPGKIVEIYKKQDLLMGKVDFSGATREVCLEHVPDAEVGDYAIVHVGFALSLLSEEEALESIDLLRQVVEAAEETPHDNPSPLESNA
jgi:hydrogenase expression/formation protein HypC